MKKYLDELIALSKKAYEKEEIPVGCLIVCQGKIVARGYNLRETNKDVLAHAEIIAIKQANKKIGDWRLNNCEMYVTLAPCKMCRAIIEASRIKKVFYLIENSKEEACNNTTNFEKIVNQEYEQKYKKTFQKLFQKIR